jgi:ABC-2 type transport system permease protein
MSTPEHAADLTPTDAEQGAATPAVYGRPPVLRTLIRREFWEHRALWIAPLSVAALLLIGAVIGKVSFDASQALPEQRRALFGFYMTLAALPQVVTLLLTTTIYAGDCLYTERKDRSILFWKSMPVSDTLTVLSKVLVVMVIVPLGIYLVSALTTLASSGIYLVRAWQDHTGDTYWDAVTWLRVQGISLVAVVAGVLWYAPLIALLMLASAWARRSVWLWVFLPPVVLIMMERIALQTSHVWNVVWYRLGGVFVYSRPMGPGVGDAAAQQSHTLNLLFTTIDPFPVFTNADLWLGLAVAALLIVVTIRIRQYRDDT